jgi:hypothetical protein
MRIEGQSKMGYYATPETQLPLIASWLKLAGGETIRLLDPCCGKGEALSFVAHNLGKTTTYGIELSYSRAEEAARVLDFVLETGFENAILTEETFSFCWLNPPYDGETTTGGGERLESRFLLSVTPLLCQDGILVYIIPESRVDDGHNNAIARHLAGWYTDLRCFRFTEPDYSVFRQVVIFGRKKAYRQPTLEAANTILSWAKGQAVTGYDEQTVPLTDDELAVTRLEKTFGKMPEELQVLQGKASLLSGQPLQVKYASESTIVWALKAQQWLDEHYQTLAGTEKRPNKTVRIPQFTSLPTLEMGQAQYPIPPSPMNGPHSRAFRFKHMPVTDEDYLRAADRSAQALEKSRAWLALTPEIEAQTITPVMTPKQGHVSMLVSAGLLGTTCITHNGAPLLLKGGTEKYTVKIDEDNEEEEIEYDPDDPQKKKQLFRVRVEERSRPTLYTLDGEGIFTFTNNPTQITDTLRVHVSELAQRVLGRNVPRYDLKPAHWEWQVFDPLSLGRTLPGRIETGLTEFQKHTSIGLGRLLLATGSGMAGLEMGCGKTCVSLAVAEYITAYLARNSSQRTAFPMLVVGPGIVTGNQNWPKEVREVIPGAEPRVIEAAARPLPKPAKVVDWLKATGVTLADETIYEGRSHRQAFREIVAEANRQGKLQGPQNSTMRLALWHTLRRGEKQPPRKREGAEKPNLLDTRIGGMAWLGLGSLARDKSHADEMQRRYTLAQFITEFQNRQLPAKSVAILSYETAKLGSGRIPAMTTRKVLRVTRDGDGNEQREIITVCSCPCCGEIVADEYDEEGNPQWGDIIIPAKAKQFIGAKRRYCQARSARWTWNPDTGQHEWLDQDPDGKPFVCGSPLFEYTELRRESVARYVQRKAKGFFPFLVADECHEAAAQSTGNGWALAVLAGATSYTLGLSGTLFKGNSTSIFWLMFRLSSLVRQEFSFHGGMAWASKYGLLRHTFYVTNPEKVLEDGAYTGQKFLDRVDERPGILPAIMQVSLPKIVFGSLKDIGLPLPPYGEEVVWIKLTDPMADQYHDLADGSLMGKPYPSESLYRWATDELKDGTKGALSVWLVNALGRVNTMFRNDEVWFNRRVAGQGKYAIRVPELVTKLPALSEGFISPKETWLASRCQAERAEGRKIIVFVRQTGERDIQPHLAKVLQESGLRVGVMTPTIEPRRRVEWIEKQAPKIDVLLTNPKLVRVGLNLRMFSTAVFQEIEYSLPVMWQAMRRVYRPGAILPIRVLFPTYENTLEEHAINLMGQKMTAAQLFFGDEVASALCGEDDGDFLNDLILSVLKQEQLERVNSIFAIQNDMTASPSGSPTAISPRIAPLNSSTIAEWLASRQAVQTVRRSGRSQPKQAQPGQLLLL